MGRDPKTDLALLKIEGASDLHPLNLGNSEDIEGRQLGRGRRQSLRTGTDRDRRHRQRQGKSDRLRTL